jgi:uncharacterized protein (TIGR00251 family)
MDKVIFIKVKVFPGAKKQEIIEKNKNSFEIKVKEKPKQGRANQEAIVVLSRHFGVPFEKIKLIKGHHQANKKFVLYK